MAMSTMKRLKYLLILTSLCAFSCETKKEINTPEAESFTVYTSNYPLYYFTSRIAPANVEVRFPFDGTSDPAYWEVIPDTVSSMQSADLIIIKSSKGDRAGNRNVVFVQCIQGPPCHFIICRHNNINCIYIFLDLILKDFISRLPCEISLENDILIYS